MSADDVLERVLKLVAGVAGPERTPADADAATPLLEGGFWLDSVDLLETVLACEEQFGIELDRRADLAGDALVTVGGLATAISRRLPA
jgi:acyl carrier protein